MDPVEVIENFYGVYLLKCLNPKYKGRTYIGYTVNPSRRIKQHNRGKRFGGAWKTSQKGPWEMILTVHGFPSDISALRFEWAWQHPLKSRRLKNIVKKKRSSESSLEYNLRIMFLMLSVPPWNRLPLTIRWISADAAIDAPPNLMPPPHMPVAYGEIKSKKIKNAKMLNSKDSELCKKISNCQLCGKAIDHIDFMDCLNSNCTGMWHILCLANKFLEEESVVLAETGLVQEEEGDKPKHIIPVDGSCPVCKSFMLWGDLIRKKNGCYANINDSNESSFSGN